MPSNATYGFFVPFFRLDRLLRAPAPRSRGLGKQVLETVLHQRRPLLRQPAGHGMIWRCGAERNAWVKPESTGSSIRTSRVLQAYMPPDESRLMRSWLRRGQCWRCSCPSLGFCRSRRSESIRGVAMTISLLGSRLAKLTVAAFLVCDRAAGPWAATEAQADQREDAGWPDHFGRRSGATRPVRKSCSSTVSPRATCRGCARSTAISPGNFAS